MFFDPEVLQTGFGFSLFGPGDLGDSPTYISAFLSEFFKISLRIFQPRSPALQNSHPKFTPKLSAFLSISEVYFVSLRRKKRRELWAEISASNVEPGVVPRIPPRIEFPRGLGREGSSESCSENALEFQELFRE